jgi:ElaB/YqjD/DUF883 family membrane-anchored ribosome-binding protein
MPPREPDLPEGTDQIVNEVTEPDRSAGFIASGGSERPTDKLIGQVRDQVTTLKDQATDKLRGLADDGKDKAATLLDDVAGVIADAARSIDQRLGKDYSEYAERASAAVAGFADRVRDKSVDDIVDDTRSVVRKSPALAIAAAAIVGFALVRVIRTGIEDASGTGRRGKAGRSIRRSGEA